MASEKAMRATRSTSATLYTVVSRAVSVGPLPVLSRGSPK